MILLGGFIMHRITSGKLGNIDWSDTVQISSTYEKWKIVF